MSRQRQRRAFTLIELLIVVLIIAILAAIAVPNFLEAQVRAKTARAASDMRALATALEAYRVDGNNYPPENWNHPLNAGPAGTLNAVKLARLTTPVAYITSLPADPFASDNDPFAGVEPMTYHYVCLLDLMYPNNPFFDGANAEGLQCLWGMQSNGPDRLPEPYQFPRYDPTNGSVSLGNILRFGP